MKRPRGTAADLVQRVEDWYLDACDGKWEHRYGVKIETLDNPGWLVTVDLTGTEWSRLTVDKVLDQRTETDWIQIDVSNGQFTGYGGAKNLSEILERFLAIVDVKA